MHQALRFAVARRYRGILLKVSASTDGSIYEIALPAKIDVNIKQRDEVNCSLLPYLCGCSVLSFLDLLEIKERKEADEQAAAAQVCQNVTRYPMSFSQ